MRTLLFSLLFFWFCLQSKAQSTITAETMLKVAACPDTVCMDKGFLEKGYVFTGKRQVNDSTINREYEYPTPWPKNKQWRITVNAICVFVNKTISTVQTDTPKKADFYILRNDFKKHGYKKAESKGRTRIYECPAYPWKLYEFKLKGRAGTHHVLMLSVK